MGQQKKVRIPRDLETSLEKQIIDRWRTFFLQLPQSIPALNKLIILDKKTKGIAGQLKLCFLKPEILEVFVITRLNQLFEIVEDEDKPKHEGFAPNSFVSNYVTEQQRKTFELFPKCASQSA